MPPYDFDPNKRSYRNNGEYISRRETREKIDKLTEFIKREAGRIAKRYDAGTINAAQFNAEMRELLKAGHIIASSVGRGGLERMTLADWGKVGNKIKWQYQFLDRMTRQLERGAIANTASRAKQYVSSIYVSYADAYFETNREFKENGGVLNPNGEILVARELNAAESCDDCEALAALGFIPLDDMPEIGEGTSCGDFCKCDLIFTDV